MWSSTSCESRRCPKCGKALMGQPRYCGGQSCRSSRSGEHLHETCSVCGYNRSYPCADAKVKEDTE